MALVDKIKTDASKVFLQPGHFREQVIYYPGGDANPGRPILALIHRNPPQRLGRLRSEKGYVFSAIIEVENDADAGINAATFSQQTDRIDIPLSGPGTATVRRGFSKDVYSVDVGMLMVSVL